jgi:ankyrin repeat protein
MDTTTTRPLRRGSASGGKWRSRPKLVYRPRNNVSIAVCSGNVEHCEKLLRQGHELSSLNPVSVLPLHEAVRRGDHDMTAVLLRHGAAASEVETRTHDTPMAIALRNNDAKACDLLIQNGASCVPVLEHHVQVDSHMLCRILELASPVTCLRILLAAVKHPRFVPRPALGIMFSLDHFLEVCRICKRRAIHASARENYARAASFAILRLPSLDDAAAVERVAQAIGARVDVNLVLQHSALNEYDFLHVAKFLHAMRERSSFCDSKALHIAVRNNWVKACKVLLEACDFDPYTRDENGQRPIDVDHASTHVTENLVLAMHRYRAHTASAPLPQPMADRIMLFGSVHALRAAMAMTRHHPECQWLLPFIPESITVDFLFKLTMILRAQGLDLNQGWAFNYRHLVAQIASPQERATALRLCYLFGIVPAIHDALYLHTAKVHAALKMLNRATRDRVLCEWLDIPRDWPRPVY